MRARFSVRPRLEALEDRLAPAGFETLYNFAGKSDGEDGNEGAAPMYNVIMGSNGNLIGAAGDGGADHFGTLFQLNPSSGNLTLLHTFAPVEGSGDGGLIEDSRGNLFGVTIYGAYGSPMAGGVYEFSADGTFTMLHTFNGSDGRSPMGSLVRDSEGNLYGTTYAGGADGANDGTVFELSPNGSGGYNFTTLHTFNGSDGAKPGFGLLMDGSGNFYGTTEEGGADNAGTVFELSPNGNGGYNFSTLHSFTGGSDGNEPRGPLTMGGNGNLYGTTLLGGANNVGTAFELNPSTNALTTIYSFQAPESYQPSGNLVLDSQGNLYGTTWFGGPAKEGTVYELSPNGSGAYNLTVLHTFVGNGVDGGDPYGGLTADSSGNLYGTTIMGVTGGDYNWGTVFELPDALNGGSTTTTTTTTTASNATTPFSGSAQNVTLTAGVTSSAGTVNSGTVTFSVMQGSAVIGTATTSATVSNGAASVIYALPANLAGETYTIDAVYNPGADFQSSSDDTHTLTVSLGPTITTNPSNQTVWAGQSATFTAAANSNPAATVQWQVSSDGATWTDLSGETSTTLTLNNVVASQNGNEYRAMFRNSFGTAATSAAMLTVQTPATITSSNIFAGTAGGWINFTVRASGTPTPTLTLLGTLPLDVTFKDNGDGTATLGGFVAAGTQGTYHFIIAANNGAGHGATQSCTLLVNSVPPPPLPTDPPAPTPLQQPPVPTPSVPTPSQQPPALNKPPLLALLDGLLGAVETIVANDTETVTEIMFGYTPIVSTYNSSGNFVSATLFGIKVPNRVWYL